MHMCRTIPVYLTVCALALAVWAGVAPSSASALTFGWTLAGMIALYAASTVVLRARGPEQSVTHALAEAAQVNAARVVGPPAHTPGATR
jgi:hypothetical protein